MSVEPWHRSALKGVHNPGPHDNIRAFSNAAHQGAKLSQVIAAIGIRKDDNVSLGSLKTAAYGLTVAATGLKQDRCTGGRRRIGAPIA